MPIGGDPDGPIFEGWTLLSALAAQTERLRLGLLVTSNRFRPPAVLAKIADDRRRRLRRAARLRHRRGLAPEHPAGPARVRGPRPALPRLRPRGRQPGRGVHGHPAAVDRGQAVRLRRHLRPPHRGVRQPQARPAAASADRDRRALDRDAARGRRARRRVEHPRRRHRRRRLAAARCSTASAPRSAATPPRSPARSYLPVSYDHPGATRDAIGEAIGAGFGHVVLGLAAPYPDGVARWVADEIIGKLP